ncbi:hypothetical protein EG329_008559 [Mollisiaceae sp. DMI_Dod_QoI]|nr:hypothetical protein EG329_008559 [Helotiales sp. DMI_Dod_QoI]
MNSRQVFKAYVGPFHSQNRLDFWANKNEDGPNDTHDEDDNNSRKTSNAHKLLKNQELVTAAVAMEKKLQLKQQQQLANLTVKQANHAKFQRKVAKKLLRLKEAMKIAEAGGIPKGFEEYPLYGGGDDEVTAAIKEKLWKDLLEIKPAVEKSNAIEAQIEKTIKFTKNRISIRYG